MISARLTPLFEGPAALGVGADPEDDFTASGEIDAVTPRASFGRVTETNNPGGPARSLAEAVRFALERKYAEYGVREQDLEGFRIHARISSIEGAGLLSTPPDQALCFDVVRAPADRPFRQAAEGVGVPCETVSGVN